MITKLTDPRKRMFSSEGFTDSTGEPPQTTCPQGVGSDSWAAHSVAARRRRVDRVLLFRFSDLCFHERDIYVTLVVWRRLEPKDTSMAERREVLNTVAPSRKLDGESLLLTVSFGHSSNGGWNSVCRRQNSPGERACGLRLFGDC